MNIGKFVALSDSAKAERMDKSYNCVKSFCSLCGKPVNGLNYCFGCHCFVCERCDDDNSKHICAGASFL